MVLALAFVLSACSGRMVNLPTENTKAKKVPNWYLKHQDTGKEGVLFKGYYYAVAVAVSPDMEMSMKKAVLKAKAKITDRINGEMNNRTTITKNESGTNEDLNVTAGSQDVIVNVIEDTLARGYEVTKQEMYLTKDKSYRVYIMIEVSKKEVEEIINQVNKNKLAVIDTKAIQDQADKILN